MFLYAVRDKNSGKIINNLTNSGMGFWRNIRYPKEAIEKAKNYWWTSKMDLEVVKFELIEVKDG